MLKKSLLAAAVLTITSSAFAAKIVRVPNTAINRMAIEKLDLDHDGMGKSREYLEFLMDEQAEKKIQAHSLYRTQLFEKMSVTVEDAEAQFRQIARSDDLGVYHTWEEMKTELDLVAEKFPKLAKLEVIGKTFEGNPIHALILTNSDHTATKKNYLVIGSHHAREWISVEVPLASIQDLVSNYGKEEEATKILDSSTLVYVPMLNVDGTVYSHTKSKMWRKNRNSEVGSSVGVDNNRNYSYKWGVSGASSSPWSDTYKGPAPMSELENQAIENLQKRFGFVASVSFHSYSELVIWPWSYTAAMTCKDDKVFRQHGEKMAKILEYEPMMSAELYPAAGDTDDFLYGNYGVLSYTIELGRQFVPTQNEVPGILKKTNQALRYLFVNAREPLATTSKEDGYEVATKLQNLVKNITENAGEEILNDSLRSLSSVSEKDLQKGMDLLQMKMTMRARIANYLKKAKGHESLYE